MIINAKTENQLYDTFNSRIKVFSNGQVQIRNYKDKIWKKKEGFQEVDEIEKPYDYFDSLRFKDKSFVSCNDQQSSPHEKEEFKEIRVDNLSRTRNSIIDYACENADKFKSFVTLTFKENIEDIDFANKCFRTWREQISRLCKKNGDEFYYLGVYEFQKRGAIHYHLLTSLPCNSVYLPLQEGKKSMYDCKYWKHGFTSAFDIENDTDDNFNVSLYLIKYLYKDIDNRYFGKQKILKSNNLKKPDVYKLSQDSVIYKSAQAYIFDKIKKDECSLTNITTFDGREENKCSFQNLTFIFDKDYTILKDILKDNLPF